MWDDEELQLLSEFRDLPVEKINLKHIAVIRKAGSSFGKVFQLSSIDTSKLMELIEYLLKDKQ